MTLDEQAMELRGVQVVGAEVGSRRGPRAADGWSNFPSPAPSNSLLLQTPEKRLEADMHDADRTLIVEESNLLPRWSRTKGRPA